MAFDPLKGFKEARERARTEKEDRAYETKTAYMTGILGREHDMVMHAIIPYAIGGALDLYYFPDYQGGTAVATKELVNEKFDSPSNRDFDAYEFVMVSRHAIDLEGAKTDSPAPNSFGHDHRQISRILNPMARYSAQAVLNAHETVEFPADFEHIGGKCLLLDRLADPISAKDTRNRKFGLMLIMEIHRDEMEFAMKHRGSELIRRLKDAHVYPFTGTDRPSIFA